MQDLITAAREVQDFLEQRGWPFCFIGGLALLHWGEPRLTRDLDLTILAGWDGAAPVIDACLAAFRGRLPDTRAFALENRVLLLETADSVPIDIALGALPFEAQATARARDILIGEVPLRLCSAEDLVVMKAFANRELDWADIEGIVLRQGKGLDRTYIREQLTALLEAKPGASIGARLAGILAAG